MAERLANFRAQLPARDVSHLLSLLDEEPQPPPQYRPGESSLDRQRRTRPQAPAITIFDGDFRQCAVCLEQYVYGDKLWRLQCGHTFHKECWDRAARSPVWHLIATVSVLEPS